MKRVKRKIAQKIIRRSLSWPAGLAFTVASIVVGLIAGTAASPVR